MNVLSLFDGMSCGQIALANLGCFPDKYYASEVDKFAIQQTRHVYKGPRNDGCTLVRDYKGQAVITDRLRRLTPDECARLQTVPDWYEWIVSDTQIYRMCGNGWTVRVIEHILKNLFV